MVIETSNIWEILTQLFDQFYHQWCKNCYEKTEIDFLTVQISRIKFSWSIKYYLMYNDTCRSKSIG